MRSVLFLRRLQCDTSDPAGTELIEQHAGGAKGIHLSAGNKEPAPAADRLQKLMIGKRLDGRRLQPIPLAEKLWISCAQPSAKDRRQHLHVHDLVDFVTREAYNAGKSAAKYLENGAVTPTGFITCRAVDGVRYTVPQRVGRYESIPQELKFFFRVDNNYKNVKIQLVCGDTVVKSVSKRSVAPGEMESLTLNATECEKLFTAGSDELRVRLEKPETK